MIFSQFTKTMFKYVCLHSEYASEGKQLKKRHVRTEGERKGRKRDRGLLVSNNSLALPYLRFY